MIIKSDGYRFRRGTGSPFDFIPTIDMGMHSGIPCQWCRHCHMSVDVNEQSHNQNQVFGKKYTCRRCGSVTASAVYYHVANIGEASSTLLENAKIWMNESDKK